MKKVLTLTVAILTTVAAFAGEGMKDMLSDLRNSGEYTETAYFDDLRAVGSVTHFEHKETYAEYLVVVSPSGKTSIYKAGLWHVRKMQEGGAAGFFNQNVKSKKINF